MNQSSRDGIRQGNGFAPPGYPAPSLTDGPVLIRERSATVTALTEVQALVIGVEELKNYLFHHSRVLTVMEEQIYRRLADDAFPDGGSATTQAFSPSITVAGQNCTIVLTDIVGFGARSRTDDDRRSIRDALHDLMREAFEASCIPWSALYREDRGDGILLVVRPTTPTRRLVEPMLDQLAASLRRHNQDAAETAQFKLRVALNVGPIAIDNYGVTGDSIIAAPDCWRLPLSRRGWLARPRRSV